jgi:NAD(P)H-hydrate epimerase
MLKVATAREMQLIDRVTIEKYGISGTVLMERAGLCVVSKINRLYPEKKVIVLAARKIGVRVHPVKKFLSYESSGITHHGLIVDALLGTGLRKEVREPLSGIIDKVNQLSCPVISVDIPSGICSDSGQVMGCAIMAQCTVTFGLPKRGHLCYPGADYTGTLFVEEIGFPVRLLESEKIKVNLVKKDDALSSLPPRPGYSHKGTYGHVLLVAGAKGKTGAALMAAKACLRTGSGLVTIGIPESLVNTFQTRVTEEMILPLPDRGDGTISYQALGPVVEFVKSRANVLTIGPGLTADQEMTRLISQLLKEVAVPVVIDADGLNAIAYSAGIFKKSRAAVILTPHAGEMARLLKQKAGRKTQSTEAIRNEIEKNRIETALKYAKSEKVHLVFKGAPTVTATPDGDAFLNSTGNPGMATAGTGDVLAGMISSFLAQKLPPPNAALLGVYLHGLIGDVVAEEKGRISLIASDIIKAIPLVCKLLQKGKA